MNREITIQELLGILYGGRLIILTIALVSSLTAGLISWFYLTPIYQAKSDLLISQSLANNQIPNLSLGEIETNLKLIESYQYIIKSERVIDKVAATFRDQYTYKELTKKINVETNGESQILSVIVEDPDIKRAADIANEVSRVFQAEVKLILQLNNVHILSSATVEKNPEPVRPKPILNSVIALIAGFILSAGFVLLRKYIISTIATKQDVTEYLKLPMLGEVPLIPGRKDPKKDFVYTERYYRMVTRLENSLAAESYRSIRTNIQFQSKVKDLRSIAFTSSNPGEGKSITAGNLAILLSMDKKKTVFVDLDLRKPNGHHLFGVPNRRGVTSYLTGNKKVDKVIQKTEIPNLSFIPAGPIPPNPSELLSSAKMDELLGELKLKFDYVILDCTPMIVSDAAIVSMKADGCIFIINSQKNRSREVKQKIEQLQEVNSNLLGVILNKTKAARISSYYY